jgi:hypothetical protein
MSGAKNPNDEKLKKLLVDAINKNAGSANANTKAGFETKEGFAEYTNSVDELAFQVFIGSVSVLGLFVLYRLIQKSK